MKLTKSKLKQLIKEELKKVLKEANTGYKRDDTQGKAALKEEADEHDGAENGARLRVDQCEGVVGPLDEGGHLGERSSAIDLSGARLT